MIKTGLLNTLLIYIGIIIGFANVIFVYPICLSTEEFGFRSLLFDTIMILTTISSFGLPAAIIKWFPSYKKHQQTSFNTYFILLALVTSIFFCLLIYFSQNKIAYIYDDSSPLFVRYLFILPYLLLIYVGNLFIDTFYKVYNLTSISIFFKEILIRIMTTVLCFTYYLNYINFDFFVYGFLLMYSVNFICLCSILIISKKLTFSFKKNLFSDKNQLKEVLTYSAYVFIGSASSILVIKMDTLMIGNTGENSEMRVGIYAMAVFIATLVEIPKRAFAQTIGPQIADFWSRNSFNKIKELYQQMSNTQFLIGCVFTALIWNNIEELYSIIKNTEIYSQGTMIVLIISLAKLVDMSFSYNSEIIAFSKYYRYNLFINILLLIIAFTTNFFLIPKYGIIGAAYASLISIFITNSIRLILIRIKFGYIPFTFQTIKIFILGFSLMFLKDLIIPDCNLYFSIIIKSILILSIVGCYIFFDKNLRLSILKNII